MKRSEINNALLWAKELLEKHQIKLPPFAYWKMGDWYTNKDKISVIDQVMLGWDITDYGQNDFDRFGAVLFTLRNGSLLDSSVGTPYAEKLLILKDGQRLPNHFHMSKTEDIINKAGGILAIKLYNSIDNDQVDYDSKVEVDLDGIKHTFDPGEEIHVHPGCSITLRPYQYHLFWAKEGAGDLVLGEVSSINDDNVDNHNAEAVSRFSSIEEDENILHPLCNEYKLILEA